MGKKKNKTILSCKLNGSPSRWIKRYKDDFLGLGNYEENESDGFVRRRDLAAVVGLVSLQHLGYDPKIEADSLLDVGMDVALDCFGNEWWADNQRAEREMNKKRFKKGLKWFGAFRNAILIGMLGGRWSDVSELCDWVDPGIEVDYAFEGQEEELGSVYKLLAGHLRDRPMRLQERMENRILAASETRPRFLLRTLDAIKASDEDQYQKAIRSSLTAFHRRRNTMKLIARDYIDIDTSVFLMAGQHAGMDCGDLSERDSAVLIHRTSI